MQLMQAIGRAVVDSGTFENACREVCRILRAQVPHYHWVGVYALQGESLKLVAWAGEQATEHTEIPIGRGICGLAARTGETVIVDDVNRDPRYLACFLSTRSEIVVPIRKRTRVIGEIDIDSNRPAAFNALDRMFLEWLADLLAEKAS